MTLLGEKNNQYADAHAVFDDAQVIILGVPFDGTSSHRCGSAAAPAAIRKESYNYETFLWKYGFDIENAKIHDMGDAKNFSNVNELVSGLPEVLKEVMNQKKFLITLGGEHSVTIPIVNMLSKVYQKPTLGVVYFDAHLDFRDSYLDEKYSHACVARRLSEIVGLDNIVSIGIRSYSKEEAEEIKDKEFRFYNADSVFSKGIEQVLSETLKYLGDKPIYLTIDMDAVDPAYAPGVGNPEYFGLTPGQIKTSIETLGSRLIGADIVEVSPPFDNGNTAALAAQFIQIIIAQGLK